MQAERSETLEQELEEFYQAHPDRYHPFLWREREQLLADGTDLERLDETTFALFSEILSVRMGFDRNDVPQRRYYEYVCQQVYCFFRSDAYHGERFTAEALKQMLITGAALQIIQWTGWSAALVTAAVSLVASTAIKIGVEAWCRYYEQQHPEVLDEHR